MTGIVGFKLPNDQFKPADLLAKMANALQVENDCQVDLYSDESIHLGRASLGIVNPEEQPIWNEDHSVGIILEGEIFDYQPRQAQLIQHGYKFQWNRNHAEFILHLYEEKGEQFVNELNGAFSLAIWDGRTQKLLLANDRLGFEPLYYTHKPDGFAFASGVRSLLFPPYRPFSLDFTALAQFLTFDHVLGNRTFFQDIQLLPPGSILTLIDGTVQIRTYWEPECPDHYPHRSEQDYLEELKFLLNQAVARQVPNQPAGILLSGGLDSRAIFALLHKNIRQIPLHAYTFGTQSCDDLRFAREISRNLRVEHTFFELKPDYLISKAEQGIRLTDGMENVVHMHTLANLAPQAERTKMIYKGFLGDALMGYFSYRDVLAQYSKEDLLRLFHARYPILFENSEHQHLFSKDVYAQLGESVRESFEQALLTTCSPTSLAANFFFQFDLRQRQRRLTLNGVKLVRSKAVVRAPFYDNDLLDFMLKIPQGYRLERYLFKRAFIQAFPDLAKPPYTETGYPMVPCRRELMMKVDEYTRWRLRSAGIKWISAQQKRPYAAYNQWLRKDLKEWSEGILSSQRFIQRGYFNQLYIQNLLKEHYDGRDHYKRLGALISVELWHQQFVDQ